MEFLEQRLKELDSRFAESVEQPRDEKSGETRLLRYPAKLIKLKKGANLPAKLPDSLVYWNRLECRVVSQRIIKKIALLDFY